LFVLIFTQELGIEIHRAGSGQSEERGLTWIGRNLEIGIGPAEQKADPTRIVDQIGKVGESFVLLSPIVDGAGTAGWIFDPQIVLFVAAQDVIAEAAFRTSKLKTGKK